MARTRVKARKKSLPKPAIASGKAALTEARRRSAFAALLPGFGLASVPTWFQVVAAGVKLPPGTVAAHTLRVPVAAANRVLAATVRLVADLPAGSPGDVVWSRGEAELLVHTSGVSLACAAGLVSLSIPVACEELPQGGTVVVPIAVGSEERPAGLVMSAFARPLGPQIVTSVWSEALTAFAWEALLHLAQQLCGAAGHDQAGRVLVPASVGAARDVLVLQPMARNELSSRAPEASG